MTGEQLRIGQAAAEAGMSERTLRYYEQLGLLPKSARTKGGSRRYGPSDIERLRRIAELKELLGFNLNEIADVLAAEDHLEALAAEFRAHQAPEPHRRREILDEAMRTNAAMQAQVRQKIARLETFLDQLRGRAQRYRRTAAETDGDVVPG